MEVKVLDINGKETGRKVQLSDSVFAIEPNKHAVYLDVKQYLANQRQGNHKAKERAEVAGSTRKIKKQKGTGTARAGSAKNPLFKGGGTVFGPRPRSYSFKLNKNLKRLARKSAFSLKVKESNLIVVEDFAFETPSTKNFINVLKSLGLENKKSLLQPSSTQAQQFRLQFSNLAPSGVTPAAAALRVSSSPIITPILSVVFAVTSVIGGILLALGAGLPISPYVTTVSFLIYLVCRVVEKINGRTKLKAQVKA
jgi:large subunit ribosomal protein L4